MKIGTILTLITASFLATSQAQAQNPHYQDNWTGGTGTWNATNTNWSSDAGNVYFNSNDRTTIAAPYFNGAGGTVTVDNSAGTLYNGLMQFNTGNWTLQGGDINSISTDYQALVVQMNSSSGNVTINNTINIVPNPTNGGSVFVNYAPGTTMTLGNINISNIAMAAPYNPNPSSSQTPILQSAPGAKIVFNGNYTTDPGLSGGMVIGQYGYGAYFTGTVAINGSLNGATLNSGKQFDFASGTLIFGTSNTGAGQMTFVGNDDFEQSNNYAFPLNQGAVRSLLTSGAQTITNGIGDQGSGGDEIGGSTADVSTFTNYVNVGGSTMDFTAATGGRVNFNGPVNGSIAGGLVKKGAGTVVLNSANNYDLQNPLNDYAQGTVAGDVQQGRLLINNTSGSAFGNQLTATVNVEAGATLGGSGISAQKVVVAGGGFIAPGDAGQSNLGIAASVATLHLTGGLTMEDGATLAFKIAADGASNDMLDLGAGALTLNGTTNVAFTALGTVNVWTPTDANYYTLATGTGTWTSSPTFDISAPTGYVVDHEIYNAGTHTFEVDFKEVPEPSTYALMIGGLAFLAFCVRRKNRTV
jgi:hypothetical protein